MNNEGIKSETYDGEYTLSYNSLSFSYSLQDIEISKNSHDFNEIHVPL